MDTKFFFTAVLLSLLITILSACSSSGPKDGAPRHLPVEVANIPNAIPIYEPKTKWGNPESYAVAGKTYYTLKSSLGYVEKGDASWYGTKFHGRRTSSGEPYDMYAMTAAHKTLPLPTYVEVKNLENGRKIVVKVNDRGPFHAGRIIDLSYVAAIKLGIDAKGTGKVEVRAINVSTVGRNSSQTNSDETLFVQVGAFLEKDNAERMQLRLAESSINSDIHEYIISATRQVYRVRIGPFDKRENANNIVDDLQGIGVQNAKVISE